MIEEEILQISTESLSIILLLSILFVIMVLLLIYKNIIDVVLSLLSLAISIIWTYGFASVLNYSLNPLTMAIPVLLTGLGIDYSIHIAYKFLEGKDSISSISRTGSALFGSALTTIAAFGLLSLSPLPQISLFGMAISVGIVYSFISCMFILPILLQYWKSLHRFS